MTYCHDEFVIGCQAGQRVHETCTSEVIKMGSKSIRPLKEDHCLSENQSFFIEGVKETKLRNESKRCGPCFRDYVCDEEGAVSYSCIRLV